MIKVFNKLIAAAALLLASNTAFAGLIIQQDIVSEGSGVIGSITYNTANGQDDGFGFIEMDQWEEFSFFGFNLDPNASFLFLATIDSFDTGAGLIDLVFDVNDDYVAEPWAFNGSVGELFNPGATGLVDVFDPGNSGIIAFFDDVYFGNVNYVSEPGTIALFLVIVAGMMVRSRRA